MGDAAENAAARLIDTFGSLADLFAAEKATLRVACEGQEQVLALILLVHDLMRHSLKCQITRRPVLSHLDSLRDYLFNRLAFVTHEIALGLFLDSRNALIKDVILSQGTINRVTIYPREVVKQSLNLGATALILVHNHPSGDCKPSRADIQMTRNIIDACRTIDVAVHDHIIVARSGLTSMRATGYL